MLVFLGAVPAALGLPWMMLLPEGNRNRLPACLPAGYFIELAVFHFLAVPFAFLGWPFSTLAVIFSCVTAALVAFSIWFAVRHRPVRLKLPRFTAWELFYLAVFLLLLGWQMYNVAVRDTTFWSYDDASYVTIGADAVRYNRMLVIDESKGIATTVAPNRALQSSLFFPAFLTLITGIPVTVMNRTVLEVFYVFLAYTVFAYMASVVFKKKENGLIFLVILSVLHIWGLYSQYSVTFRLLGPNYQGKAVPAASLIPFMFAFLIQKLEEDYDRKPGVLLMLISTAATAMSLFGAAAFVMNLALAVILSLIRKPRRWKHLRYLAWGTVMPAVYAGVYFVYKYFMW